MTPSERAARERKQKIFVVVGGVLLLGMLAFQLPKLLGGSSSPPVAAAEETTLPGGATTPATPTPRAVRVALVDTDKRLVTPGKLSSFSVFSVKDPFIQQESNEPVEQSSGGGSGTGSGGPGTTKTPRKGFTVGGSGAAVTIISVNGARQALEPGAAFPASDPVFVLVAEQPGIKTALIGIAGGDYANGAKATKLKVGKPITLVNTTTGARYRVVLIAVGNGETAKSAKSEQAP
ncbi:MAG: hypothetical protein ACRDOF_08265 [Gaiellaceae bacterium]